MEEKKHIDRLYQEKFKDFEAVPREAVWKSISAKLKEEERNKSAIMPLWTRIAGIAAVLSLLFLIGDWLFQPQVASIVNSEEQIEDENRKVINLKEETSIAERTDAESTINVTSSVPAKKSADNYPAANTKRTERSVSSLSSARIEKTLAKSTLGKDRPNTGNSDTSTSEESFLKRSIFDELEKPSTDEAVTSSSVLKRFDISTQAAPVYYGNMGKSSFIDRQFNDNNSSGEITYSYGINLAYAISDKIKIRSGVQKVSMSYNTNEIAYQAVLNPNALSGINYSSTNTSIEVMDAARTAKRNGEPAPATNRRTIGDLNYGFLNQKIGFIEVPLEVEYHLTGNRLAVNLIGGASTLFLDENMISVNSGDRSAILGEANDLNNVSFSTNVGLGLDYKLNSRFRFNLEPMFKYQVNTFNRSSGDLQPYYIAIYSGFSYEF